jgi:hypothetical protein
MKRKRDKGEKIPEPIKCCPDKDELLDQERLDTCLEKALDKSKRDKLKIKKRKKK